MSGGTHGYNETYIRPLYIVVIVDDHDFTFGSVRSWMVADPSPYFMWDSACQCWRTPRHYSLLTSDGDHVLMCVGYCMGRFQFLSRQVVQTMGIFVPHPSDEYFQHYDTIATGNNPPIAPGTPNIR